MSATVERNPAFPATIRERATTTPAEHTGFHFTMYPPVPYVPQESAHLVNTPLPRNPERTPVPSRYINHHRKVA